MIAVPRVPPMMAAPIYLIHDRRGLSRGGELRSYAQAECRLGGIDRSKTGESAYRHRECKTFGAFVQLQVQNSEIEL